MKKPSTTIVEGFYYAKKTYGNGKMVHKKVQQIPGSYNDPKTRG